MDEMCRICGNKDNIVHFGVKERLFNNGECFDYSFCRECGTLQLNNAPEDMNRYYGKQYYSFNMTGEKVLRNSIIKSKCLKIFTNKKIKIPYILQAFIRPKAGSIMRLYATGVNTNSSILDVGGGNGKWLYRLWQWGFTNLTCLDKYCASSAFDDSISFINCDIADYETTEKYDLIVLNHSFEHMSNPDAVLRKLHSLLKDTGTLLICIPLCGGIAWERYHENWWQIDAPRHYYLFSKKAIKILTERNNFKIERIVFDSDFRQFMVSEYYSSTNLSTTDIHNLDAVKKVKTPFLSVVKYNRKELGDSAVFYLNKIGIE